MRNWKIQSKKPILKTNATKATVNNTEVNCEPASRKALNL